jgi:hypothetical protein
MNFDDDLKLMIKSVNPKLSAEADRRILAAAGAALDQSTQTRPGANPPRRFTRSLIMKSPWFKFAAAAAVIIAVIGIALVADKSATPAYAIEQTIQAFQGIRTMHVRCWISMMGMVEDSEMWLELDETGKPYSMRSDAAKSPDGPKIVVWRDKKINIWFKARNMLMTCREDNQAVAKLMQMAQGLDAGLVMKGIRYMQEQKKIKLGIDMPAGTDAPIVVTADLPANGYIPALRWVFQIDGTTKLVKRFEELTSKDGKKYELQKWLEYLDYNRPIDPQKFVLDTPSNVTRIDQTVDMGVPKGNMTDEQVAVAVVRQFIDALIAKNYEQASRLYSGMPPTMFEKAMAKDRIIRIVSFGKPTPFALNGSLRVPCKVEFEKAGIQEIKPGPYVRPVFGQPDRWEICGGF